jgi:hypothetical protein
MINTIFDLCVRILVVTAGWLGISYQAINVWVFVIIWPLLTLTMLAVIFWQARKLRQNALDSPK